MDENLRSRIIPSDPSTIETTSSSSCCLDTTFVITGVSSSCSTDLVEQIELQEQEEIATTKTKTKTPYMAESLSTKWTDQKHRLFLSSMEASFVKQLFSHEYRPKPDPSARGPSSGQFKVLQSGHWKQLNFDRPQPQLDVVDESSALLENPWIQRYRPGRRHREVTSPKMEENGSPCDDLDETDHFGGNKTTTTTVVATSSRRFSNCHTQLYHQESVGSSAEVSDQNFPIEDHKGEQLSSFSRAKRMKTTTVDNSSGVDVSNKDQVVPTGMSPVMAVPPI